MVRFPNYCNNLANKLFPKQKKDKKKRESECIGKGGPCYYFIFIFYITIYAGFVFAYVRFVHPQLQNVYKSHLEVHRVLTFLVLPWPWVLFVAFQFMDPGEITPKNVFSYIKKYPYDNVLYVEGKVCPTLHVPVVARSRYCRYTKKRIACYDHYCPWVLVSVGERTHRYFMLFLLANIIASTYYSFGLFFYLKYFIGSALDHVYWSDSKFENFFYAFIVIFQTSPIVLGIFSVLVIITASLLSFFVQQFYYISVNRTTIELGKIAKVKLQHKLAKYDAPYEHFYDHGFIQNWKEFLFPEKVEEHEPVYFKDDHDFEQFLKNQNKLQKGKNSGDESMKLKKA